MNRSRLLRLDRGAVILLAIFLLAGSLLFKPWIHGFDTVAYYSWLRSGVIDGDLHLRNEFDHYGFGNEAGETATGYTVNEWAIGSALLWLPFFLIAHGGSLVAHHLGLPVAIDGYAAQYIWAISLGSALYGFAAVLLTYWLGRELFGARISLLATVAAWLAGPLVFYMFSHPAMSHANDAFAYALFLFTWFKTRGSLTWNGAARRGAAAGLCALVRQMNAYLGLLVVAEYIVEGAQQWRRARDWRSILPALQGIAAFTAAWWLVYSPQLIVWRTVFGNWIELNPYAYTIVGGGFDWTRPHLLEVLFSTNRGLFVWAPLFLIAALGWRPLRKISPQLMLLTLVSFVVHWYLVSVWVAWHGAAAFGQRLFTNFVPAFALGLAALMSVWQTRVGFRSLAAMCIAFIVWNALLIVRYAVEDVARTGPVPLDHLVIGQFTVLPRYFKRLLQIILTRT